MICEGQLSSGGEREVSGACLSTERFFDRPVGRDRAALLSTERAIDRRGKLGIRNSSRRASCYSEFSIDRRCARALIARNEVDGTRSRDRLDASPSLSSPRSLVSLLSSPFPLCLLLRRLLLVLLLSSPRLFSVDRSTAFSRGRACSRTTMSERETI